MSSSVDKGVPCLRKAARVTGEHLVFLDACEEDADFVHALRSDPVRARFLSAIPPEAVAQRQWLRRYAKDNTQAYFIITKAVDGQRLGTVRLYDAQDDSFSWGSWLLIAGLPSHFAIESALMVYHYATGLGFRRAHFEVVEQNVSVRRFHERFGARSVGWRDGRIQYQLEPDALQAALLRYRRFLSQGIQVEYAGDLSRVY